MGNQATVFNGYIPRHHAAVAVDVPSVAGHEFVREPRIALPPPFAQEIEHVILGARDEALEASENRDYVRSVLARLPEALREVVTLIYYQGLKYREAAEVLSLPVGTVKSHWAESECRINS